MPDFAFPSGDFEGSFGPDERFRGISKRDYFAAKAMQAIIQISYVDGCDALKETKNNHHRNMIAETAYMVADAMIEKG